MLPSTPTKLSSILIPEDMRYNNTKQEFLFCNSPTPHKVIAFASDRALKLLSDNPHWNGDGTCRTSPALFIHVVKINQNNVILNYFNH